MEPASRIEQLERENASLREQLAAHSPSSDEAAVERVLSDRMVLENLPDVITVMNREHRLLYLNHTVPNRRIEETRGTNALDYIAKDQLDAYLRAFETAWTTGVAQRLEVYTVSDFDWETRLFPIKQNGRVAYMLGASVDITERKRAERALDESQSRLRLAVEASGMGIWTWDRRSDEIGWDTALARILGLPASSIPRRYDDFLTLLHPEDRTRVDAALQRSLDTQIFEDLEYRVLRADGEVRYVLSKAGVFRDQHGAAIGLRGGIIDLTERKRLEEQVREVHKMEAVGRLTAGIAHNFNNLLSVIIPNVTLCRSDAAPDSELGSRLADIELAAKQAAEMVRQLMLFARSEGGSPKNSIDVVAVVRRTLEICRTTFERKIALELELGEPVSHASFAPGQLEQVLLNILINARDAFDAANTAAPRILVKIERSSNDRLRISVADNGPGMDEATRLRVFEPFFTTKDVGRGTGLGLSTAYAIVVDHHGTIRCHSELGSGTRFEIELPVATFDARLSPRDALTSEVPASGTLLIVDDEPLVRRALRALLERAGYNVLEADGGRSALALIESGSPPLDAILLDRSMPGMSGIDVLARLAAIGNRVPVALISGQHCDPADYPHARAVLSKPIDRRSLLEALARLTAKAR